MAGSKSCQSGHVTAVIRQRERQITDVSSHLYTEPDHQLDYVPFLTLTLIWILRSYHSSVTEYLWWNVHVCIPACESEIFSSLMLIEQMNIYDWSDCPAHRPSLYYHSVVVLYYNSGFVHWFLCFFSFTFSSPTKVSNVL